MHTPHNIPWWTLKDQWTIQMLKKKVVEGNEQNIFRDIQPHWL